MSWAVGSVSRRGRTGMVDWLLPCLVFSPMPLWWHRWPEMIDRFVEVAAHGELHAELIAMVL
jgi:hypothetical protein